MEKQRKLIVRGFIAGLLGVILSAGIAWAGQSFDPHTAEGGLPQCKADLATCLNALEGPTASASKCEADLAACLRTIGVQRTGQTEKYGPGDDGDLQMGVMWSSPRFTDNNNGTVTDNFTGLIWTQNANLLVLKQNWNDALGFCNGLADGAYGLSDGSNMGDWRIPNVKELQTLIDYSRYNPALPTGHPFANVQSFYYWSSTTYFLSTAYYTDTNKAWLVSLNNGSMTQDSKSYPFDFVWCVRGGQ
jgi:hypothetical protein